MAKKINLPTYEEIESMTPKQLSASLKKLKPLATSRVKRIKEAGKESYLRDLGVIYKDFKTRKSELTNIVQLLRKPFSKLSYIKHFENKMLKKLHEKGYDIKDDEITEFNEFMGEIKAMYKGRRIPDSTRVAEAFIQAKRLKMSKKALKKNLRYWREHLEDLRKLKTSNSKSTYSAKQIRDRIERMKAKSKSK